MTFKVFSNLDDSVILWPQEETQALLGKVHTSPQVLEDVQ